MRCGKAWKPTHCRRRTRNARSWITQIGYTADEIDFLAAYIFPEDTWYVFPVVVVENRTALCITPSSKRSPFEQYRETWKLMGSSGVEPTAVNAAAAAVSGT